MPYAGLVVSKLSVANGVKWVPKCQAPPFRQIPSYLLFEKWWRAIVINNKKGGIFTREKLVLAVSEQDGGISVASKIDPTYVDLARKNAMGWKDSEDKPILGAELASIREISWEVLEGLRQSYPQYFAN